MSTQQSIPPSDGQNLPATIHIMDKDVQLITYQDHPVVTFRMVDDLHQRVDGTARKTFYRHKSRFIEGEDYFDLPYEEWKPILDVHQTDISNYQQTQDSRDQHRSMIFLTESGYLMVVKPFTDDISWKVQRDLVRMYFSFKRMHKDAEEGKISPELEALLLKLGIASEQSPSSKIAGNFYLIISCQRSIIDIVKCLEAIASGKTVRPLASDLGYFFCQSIESDSLKIKPECPVIVRSGAATLQGRDKHSGFLFWRAFSQL
ncbi:MAG: ORF6N domain-containing protein [bacterium]